PSTRTPEQEFAELIKRDNVGSEELFAAYDKLAPIPIDKVVGSWKGGSVNTGHPTQEILKSMSWAGKDFHSSENVDPIMIYNAEGERVWESKWGHARLRQVEFRGKVSTAMIYDDHPIIDYFRYVNDDLIAGAMDAKTFPGGTYFFYLHK
ncbi:hypothetical protein N7495_009920, partial [Penicillium taxi]|uniref:uncharacterized protein n=1 Tax=Penicillium taxi TaxID=168475 RepID=UPI002545AA4A